MVAGNGDLVTRVDNRAICVKFPSDGSMPDCEATFTAITLNTAII